MITAKNLQREFHTKMGIVQAIEDITFHIPEGEIVGIVGENGAGKTTLLHMITGLLAPTDGYLRTMRKIPYASRKSLSKDLAVLYGRCSRLHEQMTVKQSMELEAILYGVSKEEYQRKLLILDPLLNLSSILDNHKVQLSLGERMRADLGLLLLRDSKLIILDEPFLGLDAMVRNAVSEYLLELTRQNGTTIVFTSHDMQDIKSLCHRLLVLKKGKSLYYGSVNYAINKFQSRRSLELEILGKLPDLSDLPVKRYQYCNQHLTIDYDSDCLSTKVIMRHILEQTQVRSIKTNQGGLEEAMQSLMRKDE